MSEFDIEGLLAAKFWNHSEEYIAHVAAVLREHIADWLLGDDAYREVAFRSILNEGAAWTALRTLAAQVAPSRVPSEES